MGVSSGIVAVVKSESELNIPNAHRAAHPFLAPDGRSEGECGVGLTKRELIAIHFGAALVSNQRWMENKIANRPEQMIQVGVAKGAVELTDALLAELERSNAK